MPTCSLHPIRSNGRPAHTIYCGPAALMAVTGVSVEEAERRIRKADAALGRTPKWRDHITSVNFYTLREAIVHSGIDVRRTTFFSKRRVKEWMKEWAADGWPPGILMTSRHFIAVHGGQMVDNHYPEPRSLAPYFNHRVKVFLRIDP